MTSTLESNKIVGPSPTFTNGGKGKFPIHFTADFGGTPLPLNDQVVIRRTVAARKGLGDETTVETFIVYGDIEKGPFQLASHDGQPMGLKPGWETPVGGSPSFRCQHLGKNTTFATIHLDQSKQSSFGPSFNSDNKGILSCAYPCDYWDNASLFILSADNTTVQDVFELFFAFKPIVPGLSTIKSKGGQGCDLSYVDLTGADLSGVNLAGANLQHANLTQAILTGAKLDGTDLSGAKLEGATLSSDLTKAIFNSPPSFSTDPNHLTSFRNAKLNLALIGLNWSYLDLTDATMVGMPVDLTGLKATHMTALGIDLSGKKLVNAVFINATLTGAILTGANLDGADLSSARLEGATLSTDLTKIKFNSPPILSTDPKRLTSFKNAKLNFSLIGLNWSCLDLTDATIVGVPADLPDLKANHMTALGIDLNSKKLVSADFSHASLAKAVFNAADLTGAVFTGAGLSGANLRGQGTQLGGAHLDMAALSGAALTGVQLIGATGVAASLTYAILDKAVLDKADLKGVDFSGATLKETSMQNTTSLELAKFAGAYLNSVKFQGSKNFHGANFQNACLINCDLTGADLGPSNDVSATMEGAFLQGAGFSGVTLTNANLNGAVVSFNQGRIDTCHCDHEHNTTTPFPMNYGPTTGLEESVHNGNCICPNGNTYNNNVKAGLSFEKMCASGSARTSWKPDRCKP